MIFFEDNAITIRLFVLFGEYSIDNVVGAEADRERIGRSIHIERIRRGILDDDVHASDSVAGARRRIGVQVQEEAAHLARHADHLLAARVEAIAVEKVRIKKELEIARVARAALVHAADEHQIQIEEVGTLTFVQVRAACPLHPFFQLQVHVVGLIRRAG